jgi:hypothetical protein
MERRTYAAHGEDLRSDAVGIPSPDLAFTCRGRVLAGIARRTLLEILRGRVRRVRGDSHGDTRVESDRGVLTNLIFPATPLQGLNLIEASHR